MLISHDYDNHLESYETNDTIMKDQDEESDDSSITSEKLMVNKLNTNLYFSNDENKDENDDDGDENLNNVVQDFNCDKDESVPYDMKQISIILALFRHRHNLSKSCINDLCELLRCFGVKNVPSDFRSVERNIFQNQEKTLQSKIYTVCSTCGNKGTTESKCENTECQSKNGFKSTPTTLCIFKLLPQITSILERYAILPEADNDCSKTTDVQNSQVVRNIVAQEKLRDPEKQVITFLLNSDGVVLKKISRSIWIICMVINELPRAIRFNINNVIVCSISIGGSKPKNSEFQTLIFDWVHELHQLELGFYVSLPNLNHQFVKVHVYLIAAALDKPAQSLLMNINYPTGFYSYAQCTIRGKESHI